MSGWYFVFIGAGLVTLGGILATQGWNMLKQREEAFSLSVEPSLEISVIPSDDPNVQNLVFSNTGQHVLIDVEIHPVGYKIQTRPDVKVLSRNSWSGPIKTIPQLDLGQRIVFPSTEFITTIANEEMTETSPIEAVAIVVVYRREADKKRFVDTEPFTVAKIGEGKTLFAMFSGKLTGAGGPPGLFVQLIKEISETERVFFRG